MYTAATKFISTFHYGLKAACILGLNLTDKLGRMQAEQRQKLSPMLVELVGV
jgi:hypothetical protein